MECYSPSEAQVLNSVSFGDVVDFIADILAYHSNSCILKRWATRLVRQRLLAGKMRQTVAPTFFCGWK